uniref:Uncharacterized protein n=1 Tax=Knipowitschia caucasica TaxID=637954 RepID=A0AAV2KQN6_KNICA
MGGDRGPADEGWPGKDHSPGARGVSSRPRPWMSGSNKRRGFRTGHGFDEEKVTVVESPFDWCKSELTRAIPHRFGALRISLNHLQTVRKSKVAISQEVCVIGHLSHS